MLRLIDKEESEAGVLFQRCSKDVQKDERIILAVKEKMGGEYIWTIRYETTILRKPS